MAAPKHFEVAILVVVPMDFGLVDDLATPRSSKLDVIWVGPMDSVEAIL